MNVNALKIVFIIKRKLNSKIYMNYCLNALLFKRISRNQGCFRRNFDRNRTTKTFSRQVLFSTQKIPWYPCTIDIRNSTTVTANTKQHKNKSRYNRTWPSTRKVIFVLGQVHTRLYSYLVKYTQGYIRTYPSTHKSIIVLESYN